MVKNYSLKSIAPSASKGDVVLIHYTGRLSDGTVFDTSKSREPMRIKLGNGEVIPGFERAIIGMKPGGFVIENIPAGSAFGDSSADRIWTVSRSHLESSADVRVGDTVKVASADGGWISGRVIDFIEDAVTVDTNHPLAGQNLTFEIELLEIINDSRRLPPIPPGARESKIIIG